MGRLSEVVNVLHLTDLHFKTNDAGRTERKLALDALFDRLKKIDEEGDEEDGDEAYDWRPKLVLISGDIGYSGSSGDYASASEFLARLRERLSLRADDFVVCPGNHDRDVSNAGGLTYPGSAKQADQWLSPTSLGSPSGALKPLVAPFRDFVEFCRKEQVLRPEGIPGIEYLTGVTRKDFGGISLDVFVLNSAWFALPQSQSGNDVRNLWLGLPLIERLQADGKLRIRTVSSGAQNGDRNVCIGMFHHPREWLHEEELDTFSDRPNTLRTIAERCDVILQGHVHGALEPPSFAYGQAQTFTGGATYSGGRYRNNFSILQINFDDMSVRRRGFEFDPRVREWIESETARGVHQLRASPNRFDRETGPVDLAGEWESVFWAESDADLRKPVQRMSISRVDGSGDRFRASSEGKVQTHLEGQLMDGIFSGTWDSQKTEGKGRNKKPFVRHGVFQLRVEPQGNRLTGRWLGYDGDNHIRVGSWKFFRVP